MSNPHQHKINKEKIVALVADLSGVKILSEYNNNLEEVLGRIMIAMSYQNVSVKDILTRAIHSPLALKM